MQPGWVHREKVLLGVAAGLSCGWDYLQHVRILEDQKLFLHVLRVRTIQKLLGSPAIKSEFNN